MHNSTPKYGGNILSLSMSGKRNGLESYAWLKNVLQSLPTQNNKYTAELFSFDTIKFSKQTKPKKASTKPSW